MASMPPYYLLRFVAGLVFLSGAVLMTFNLYMTIKGRRTIEVEPPDVTAFRK
jgi:cytochrome c oxidase cbb3-type subunit 1